jgi:hypothetical protein
MRTLALLTLAAIPLAASTAAAQRSSSKRGGPAFIVSFDPTVPVYEERVAASPEEVSEILPQVFAQIGLPGGPSISDGARVFLTPYLQVQSKLYGRPNSEFFTCQGYDIISNLADTGRMTFAIISRVEVASDGGTVLRTQVDARVTRREVASNSVECVTTGLLEKSISAMVVQRVQEAALAESRPAPAPPAPPAP